MGKTRTLLELYGSLDKAVSQSDDPQVTAAVDQLLPGASANKGWYREIEQFFFGPQHAHTDPDPIAALTRLGQADQELKDYQKLRLLYAVAALARLHSVAPAPNVKPADMRNALIAALAQLRPKGSSAKRKDATSAALDGLVDHLATTSGRRAWTKITDDLAAKNAITDQVAQTPVCKTAVVTVGGVECVVIDTEFTSTTLSLNDVKAIADPRNWDEDYHDFFCNIKELKARPDGWGRFLETVGFCGEGDEPDVGKLVTQLKYFKSTPSATEANLDYDLDDPTPGLGDGQITVDRGFINMSAPDGDAAKPPVLVRTRKVAHITGLRPWAQARLVCVTGYGTSAMEFLLGAAARAAAHDPDFDPVPWDSPVTEEDTSEQADTAAAPPASHIAQTAVDVWVDSIEGVMARYSDVSEKWFAGTLNFTDLADYSADVGGVLLGAPWKFLQAMSQPSYPNKPN
ncbi:hypothetical protein [Mycolicibacterium moriokaense]|uniref:Uncharacterized protein n=1 Tax=Mycolicibacterium moriokaense TaxID=39691 RepID=A0A318HD76_9MYCO|nr:hypothetical protein [Mycolicibacterium moriokaense]PXX06310.1 hypothetical protein C8E89_11483 [Mycolicibacterium moriokaense]